MAVAGGTAPCLRVELDGERVRIGHSENRLIRMQVDRNPETGEVEFKSNGELRLWVVPSGAAELDIGVALERLRGGEGVWVVAKELRELCELGGWVSYPAALGCGGG